MKAVVMAGGEGSRLRPLTLERPKPMITLGHAPAIEHILRLLKHHGITDIVISLHYLGSVIEDYFRSGEELGLNITYTHEDRPLGTAGSVALARDVLDEPFLVISGDALTDVDLSAFARFFTEKSARAALLLYRVENPLEYGVVITEADGKVQQFQEKPSWGEVLSDTVNTGIYALHPSALDYIPPGREVDFSLDVFPAMLRNGDPVYGYVADGYWTDVGMLDAYRQANADLVSGQVRVPSAPSYCATRPTIDPTARVDPSARIEGAVYVGRESEVRAGALLRGPAMVGDRTLVDELAEVHEATVLSNAYIGVGAKLDRCVIGRHCRLGRAAAVGQGAVVGDGTTLGAEVNVRAGISVWPRKFVEDRVVIDRNLVHGSRARRTIFVHGGVAGLANVELTPEFAARLGSAWGSALAPGSTVAANRDETRPARMFKRALMSGLASVGIRTIDIGAMPFPVARFATQDLDAAGCIHIRRSPYDPDAIDVRFLDERGIDIRPSDERKIETTFSREDFRRVGAADIAEITLADPVSAYGDALLKEVRQPLERTLGLVVDYMGGACGEVLPPLLARLGVGETAIDASSTSVSMPTPADLEARRARLGRIVPAVGATFGALIDADGNRVWITDERGRALDALEAAGLVLAVLRATGLSGTVALPVTVPDSVFRHAADLGFAPHRTPTNAPAMMRASRQRDAVLTINGRNAFGFPSLHAGPDPMATVVRLVAGLAAADRPVSAHVAALPQFTVARREVRVDWERRGAVMRRLNGHSRRRDEGPLDGVVIGAPGERAVVVPDVDAPAFRILAEAGTQALAETLADEIGAFVERAARNGADGALDRTADRRP